jgi:hypothetical protein
VQVVDEDVLFVLGTVLQHCSHGIAIGNGTSGASSGVAGSVGFGPGWIEPEMIPIVETDVADIFNFVHRNWKV